MASGLRKGKNREHVSGEGSLRSREPAERPARSAVGLVGALAAMAALTGRRGGAAPPDEVGHPASRPAVTLCG
jgi:hypothetical protein